MRRALEVVPTLHRTRTTVIACMTSFYEAPGGDTVASFDIPSNASSNGYDAVAGYLPKQNRQTNAAFQRIVRSNPNGDSERFSRGVTVTVRLLRSASKPESTYGPQPILRFKPCPFDKLRVTNYGAP